MEVPPEYFLPLELDVDQEHLTGVKVAKDLPKPADFAYFHGAATGNWSRLMAFVKPIVEQGSSMVAFDHSGHGTEREIRFRGVHGQRNEIEFDVAVTVESKGSSGGKAEIRVLGMIQAGAGGTTEQKNSVVSHVRFGLQIGAYTRKEIKEKGKK